MILSGKSYRPGMRCEKLATKGELCETHHAALRREGERKMLADIERDRARASSRKDGPRSLCDACGREYPENEVDECGTCGMPACDDCRGDRCCKLEPEA